MENNELIARLVGNLSPEGREFWAFWEHATELPEDEEREEEKVSDEEFREGIRELEAKWLALGEDDRRLMMRISGLALAQGEADLERSERALAEELHWMGKVMQEEGLRRGFTKENREKKATLGELFDLDGEE